MNPFIANSAGGSHGWMPLFDLHAWWGALAVAGMALLFGWGMTPRLRGWRRGEAWLLRGIIGLVPLVLIFLMVGQIQGLTARIPCGLLGLAGWCGVASSFLWRRMRCGAPEGALPVRETPASLLGWGVVACWLVVMLLPAVCPSINYDVLEYHLALPAQIVREGRIAPIPHVFYSAQPMLTELLYALAMLVERAAWGSSPGLLLWMLFVLGTLVFRQLARQLDWPAAWTPWLWLLLLSHPIIFTLQLDRMTDWTGALMLAAGLWISARGRDIGEKWETPMLMGVLAAGAVGAKWTNLGTVVVPLMALTVMGKDRREAGGTPLKRVIAWTLTAGLFFVPWIFWLWHFAGNPVAPFLAAWFPTLAWPPERLAFLLHTHGAFPFFPWDYWANLAQRLSFGLPGAPLPLLGLLAGAGHWVALRMRRKKRFLDVSQLPVGALTLSLLIGLLLWGQLRHAADRFLAPCCLLGLVLLANCLADILRWEGEMRGAHGAGASRLPCVVTPALAAIALLMAGPQMILATRSTAGYGFGTLSGAEYLDQSLGLTAGIFRAVNTLPPDSRVLAIDEARGYYFDRSVSLASVFDRQPMAPHLEAATDAPDLIKRLTAAGFTHILVNEFESARLLDFHPPVALENDPTFARWREGYSSADPVVHNEAQRELAENYPGWSAFAAEPLTPAKREIFVQFLRALRPRAIWLEGFGENRSPAMWIAPLNADDAVKPNAIQ